MEHNVYLYIAVVALVMAIVLWQKVGGMQEQLARQSADATMQAAEALKLAAGIGESLSGRLLLLDALDMEWRTVRFKKDAGCAVCGPNSEAR